MQGVRTSLPPVVLSLLFLYSQALEEGYLHPGRFCVEEAVCVIFTTRDGLDLQCSK